MVTLPAVTVVPTGTSSAKHMLAVEIQGANPVFVRLWLRHLRLLPPYRGERSTSFDTATRKAGFAPATRATPRTGQNLHPRAALAPANDVAEVRGYLAPA